MSSEPFSLGPPRLVAAWPLGDEPAPRAKVERPASVLEHLAHRLQVAAAVKGPRRGLVWLDSGGPRLEAQVESVLSAFPVEERRLEGDIMEEIPRFLDALASPVAQNGNGPPGFKGGWIGFLSYRAVEGLEPVRLSAPDDVPVPLASWALHPTWYRHDRAAGRLELWTRVEGVPPAGHPEEDAWRHWAEDALRAPYDRVTPMYVEPERLSSHAVATSDAVARLRASAVRSFDRPAFRDAVRQVQEAIEEGEVFQANIAHRLDIAGQVDPLALFLRLRRSNPSPFACLIEEDWGTLVSNSPERLFSVRREEKGRIARARPIAGTRPRRLGVEADRASARELHTSPKERAEHTMLVDLARNDLGRIAVPGSVRVREFQNVEAYSHVHHLVSDVEARVRPDVGVADLFRALFPGGTITGAPKLRSIEVIDRVEPVGRGPYTGSAGYVDADGTMDLNILIRSLVATPDRVWLWAGAGIVADSDPDSEYEETLHKAEAMLLALATLGVGADVGPHDGGAVVVGDGRSA